MATEEIKVDLYDEVREDNKKFINLLDAGKWSQLVMEYDEGRGQKSIDELLEELLESA